MKRYHRRRTVDRAYTSKAHAFVQAALADPARYWCPVMLKIKNERHYVSEVHHTRGRAGSLKMDERFWLALSSEGHRWVHDHPEQAREHGWMCARGLWNTPPKDNNETPIRP